MQKLKQLKGKLIKWNRETGEKEKMADKFHELDLREENGSLS